MKRIKLLFFTFLWLAACQHVAAQSDVELTDSISNEWGGDAGGGITPSMPSNPVTSLTMSQTSITIEGGEYYKLTAKTNANATNKRVIWSVGDAGIALVASDGTVFGLKTGKTIVTATSVSNPELSASCNVTVTSDYIEPESGYILPWGKEKAWEMRYLYFEQDDYEEPSVDKNGNSWKDLKYNDAEWRVLKGPMGSPYIWYSPYNYEWTGERNCFCLRRTFNLPVVGAGEYSFKMQHDDDILVYLNGELVIDEPDWTDERISTYTIQSDKFVAGENILAIFIKQNWGGAFLDYALYYKSAKKPSDSFDIGFLPDVDFEFFYDAKQYDKWTHTIPNHEAANLAGSNLVLTTNIPGYFNDRCLNIKNRCEGYIDKWGKGSQESGKYFYRSRGDCMTIVCKVRPDKDTGNASDLISNRGTGHNYMFRVGHYNSFFLHTDESYGMELPDTDDPQVLAVRVDGFNDRVCLNNFTTGESKEYSNVNWGDGGNIMKFFYNDDYEYYTGDVYWLYYSKEYVADEDLEGLVFYGMEGYTLTYVVDGEVYKTVKFKEGEKIEPLIPVKDGYTFNGWDNLPSTMPAMDITVTGSFSAKTYNIIYMLDGEEYKRVSLKCGERITSIEAPFKAGYTFSGWKVADRYERPIDIANNADVMLYSNAYCTMSGDHFVGWHVLFDNDPQTFFHSEWNGSNNSSDGLDHYLRVDLGRGDEISSFSFTYTNRGNLSDGAPKTMIVEGSNKAGGEYEEIATLTNLPGGRAEKYESDIIGNGNKYRYIRFRVVETQRNQTAYGHPFFYISEFGMTECVEDYDIPSTMPAKDITVYGFFTVNHYNVIYMVDGELYEIVSVAYGDEIVFIDEPVKDGYVFSGWSEAPETMPAEDVIITGSFEYTDIHSPTVTERGVDVYSLLGILLYKSIDNLETIARGVYIINNKVVFIR